ncbi:hypothetical protein HPB50_015367 [Hyalomma asiaticum]|uniref:Uncharacterized protein n=1 Tax=Hyalomma asiaticum TaxID=266040 RepID=A0ACB7TGX6_HYAAI|nr:hypothetical protein HPB50_015367 [Hyalomma asiaticum]
MSLPRLSRRFYRNPADSVAWFLQCERRPATVFIFYVPVATAAVAGQTVVTTRNPARRWKEGSTAYSRTATPTVIAAVGKSSRKQVESAVTGEDCHALLEAVASTCTVLMVRERWSSCHGCRSPQLRWLEDALSGIMHD